MAARDLDVVLGARGVTGRCIAGHLEARAEETDMRWAAAARDPAKLIPDEWITEVCAVGTVTDCVQTIARFRQQSPRETILYGSTPQQNAAL